MNTKKYKGIPIEDYGVVVDDTDYKDGDLIISSGLIGIYKNKCLINDETECHLKRKSLAQRIIGSIGKILDGVPLIELADTIMPLARKSAVMNNYDVNNDTYKHGFVMGHKANTNKYSEEELLYKWDIYINSDGDSEYQETLKKEIKIFLQSLQKQPIPTEVELEMEHNLDTKQKWELAKWEVKIHNKETNTITALNYK